MALVTFTPAGSQLDGDEIADLALNPGDRLTASFTLDTSGLDSDLQSLTLQIDQDFEEVEFSLVRTDFDTTTFPGLELVGISAEDNFDSAIFERQGEPGAAPNTTDIIVEGEITVLGGLNNDGQPDIGITVLDAVDANGQNVTELFEPIDQSIELQPIDAIFGKVGNDLISGDDASDALFGGNGNDRLFGDEGEDLLFGERNADRLFGGDKSDTLQENIGRDTLIGGNYSDLLVGGEDDDRLIGVELNSNEPGINEQDTLTGGLGADTFVLGNEAGIFYSDGNSFASGDADFARITDFNPQEDRILLFGFAEQYTLDFLPNNNGSIDAKLIYDSGLNSGSELITLIENVDSDLSIDDTAFAFI